MTTQDEQLLKHFPEAKTFLSNFRDNKDLLTADNDRKLTPEEFNFVVQQSVCSPNLVTHPVVDFIKTHPDAVIPTRAYPTDIGYDLTAISVKKQISENTFLFDTGIAVKPPNGYYTEILPRSSLSKTGWVLSNSVGTIDPSYRGNLLLALTCVDKTCEVWLPTELPFCKCQLILRKAEWFDMNQVENLDDTERGSGGFGSTDKTT